MERLRIVKRNPSVVVPRVNSLRKYNFSGHAEFYTNGNGVGGAGWSAIG